MADKKLVEILQIQGVIGWNQWRKINPDVKIDLFGADLNGANLRRAYLRGANLRRADLRGADLREAYLRVADLYGADLREAYLRGADLNGAHLRRAYLRGAKLFGAKLNGAKLNGANLNGANLNGANLNGANLNGANLEGANLYKAHLFEANLEGANLEGADLRGADLRGANLSGFDFREADLRGANLRGADLRGANLEGANLEGANLEGANLEGANQGGVNLEGANLRGANLSGFDFSGLDLSEVCLEGVNFSRVQALNTNFDSARLTGACIEDWNINGGTNLNNVICDYIYLKDNQQERRPSDGNRNFEPGEFTKLFEKAIETVDLVFLDGINWEAFLLSLKDLQKEYGQENVGVQGIERKSTETFILHLGVTSEMNKAEIEDKAKQFYESKLQILETQYRAELQAKDREIEIYKKQGSDMTEIVKLLANKPITVEAKAVAENRNINTSGGDYRETNLHNDSRYIETRDNSTYYENYNESQRTLAEAAKEIQNLLKKLEQDKPTANETEKIDYINDETSKGFKKRVVAALMGGGETAIEEFLDNPYVNIGKAIVKGWMNLEG